MQRGFSAIIALVVVLIIVGVGFGAYFFGKQSSIQAGKSAVSLPVPTISSNKSSQLDNTVGWKTYVNGDYSFRYPGNWSERAAYEGCGGPIFYPDDKSINGYITVCGPDINDKDTISQIAKQNLGSEKLVSNNSLFVDNHEAIIQEIKNASDWPRLEVYIAKVLTKASFGDGHDQILPGTLVVYFYQLDGLKQDESKKVLNSILPTFKFLRN